MWRTISLVALVGLTGCDDGAPTRAEHEAALARIDAMEQRIDALEAELENPRIHLDELIEAVLEYPDLKIPVPEVAASPDLRDPFAGHDEKPVEPPPLRVTITDAGLTIGGEVLDTEQARDRFAKEARRDPRPRLVLLAKPEVPYQRVIEVMDAAREQGLDDVMLTAQMHGEPTE